MSEPRDNAHYEALMMKSVDGIITDAEARELDEFTRRHPEYADELRGFNMMKSTTDDLSRRIDASARIEPPERESTPAAFPIAWAMIIGGVAVMESWMLWHALTNDSTPVVLRLCITAISVGFTILFGVLLVRRLQTAGSDPYSRIDQ